MASFFAELQRRHVYKVGAMYAVAGWLLVQVATQVFPFFEISNTAVKWTVVVIAAGFPVALVLAWLFDVTPEGIVRTETLPIEGETHVAVRDRLGTDRKLNWVLGCLLVIAMGYFIAERTVLRNRLASAAATEPTAASEQSIAVLPFENLSEEKANAFFAVGIQDEILTRLSKIAALRVISRTSTAHYASTPDNLPEIARQLGVANILEGSVQRIGDQVHINVQLIHAASDAHLWAESYDRKLDNVFSVESEVAQTIAQTLKAQLSPAEAKSLSTRPTTSAAAYDAYLRGLATPLSVGGFRQGTLVQIEAFSEAVRIDPQFADAWARLARSHAFAYWNFDPSSVHRQAAREALDHAMKLAPDSLETRDMAGLYHYWIERDYETATKIFTQIRAEAPSYSEATRSLAAIARRQGRWADSLALWQDAVRLDPRDSDTYVDAAGTAASMRQLGVAQTLVDQGLATAPDALLLIGVQTEIYQQQGRFAEAQAVLDRTRIPLGNDQLIGSVVANAIWTRQYSAAIARLQSELLHPEALGISLGYYWLLLGDLQRLVGDTVAARSSYAHAREATQAALRDEPNNHYLFENLAVVDAGLGNREAAYAQARHAVELLPASKDALDGPSTEEILVRIEARFGDADAAIPGLQRLLNTAYGYPPLTVAVLKVDPDFDPLRNDARFQKLLAASDQPTPMKDVP